MKKRLLILVLLLLCYQPAYGQDKDAPYELSFSVTILEQPDCPLKIVEVGVQKPKPDVAYVWFTVKNQSDKPIIKWNVRGFNKEGLIIGAGSGPDESEISALTPVALEPGEEETRRRLSPEVMKRVLDELTNVPKGSLRELNFNLAVVKVIFADGTKYDATERLRSLGWHLPGQRESKD